MAVGDKKSTLMDFDRGVPKGVATLGEDGILEASQRPPIDISNMAEVGADGVLIESQRPDASGIKMDNDAEEPVTVRAQVTANTAQIEEQGKKLGEVSRPNLMINWDFRNPVNRNGKSEYVGAVVGVDLWKQGTNITTVLTGSGLVIRNHSEVSGSGVAINQQIASGDIPLGQKVTLSLLDGNGGLFFGSGETPAALPSATTILISASTSFGALQFAMYPDGKYECIVAATNAGSEGTVVAVKLELGDTQTLARQLDDGTWELIDPPNYDLQYLLTGQYSPITREYVGSQHSNENLLDNWYFPADSVIDQRGGYVVPSGTAYYSDTGLATQAGTTDTYLTATYVNATYNTITVSGTAYYVAASDCVRGYAGNTPSIDRWMKRSALMGLVVESTGLRLKTTAVGLVRGILQSIENPTKLCGKIVTCSALVKRTISPDDLLYIALFTGTNSNAVSTRLGSTGQTGVTDSDVLLTFSVQIPETLSASHLNFFIGYDNTDAENEAIIKAAKLELGPVQTLAHWGGTQWVLNDPPPNKADMLARCQRYQVEKLSGSAFGIVGIGLGTNDSRVGIYIDLPTETRTTTPALRYSGNFSLSTNLIPNDDIEVASLVLSNSNCTKTKGFCIAYADGVEAGKLYVLRARNDVNAKFMLDYNL